MSETIRKGKDYSAIQSRSESLQPKLVEIRRDLHQHPELSNREFRTSKVVTEYLRKLGLEVQSNVAHTGVVALLHGRHEGPVVGVRVDMDALPIQETLEVPYKSQVEGVKHACGHDVHTTIGLGVAETLLAFREEIRGKVKFVFQPAEEGPPPGESGGASLMVQEGVLENPNVDAMFGIHVMPTIEVGKVGVHQGTVWASNDTLEINILGRKTHGAYPHTGVDAIAVAAQVILGLQTMVNRLIDVRDPLLISFGIMEGGNQFNVLADRVRLVGMVRCLTSEVREAAPRRIEEVLRGITQSFGASYTMALTSGAPVTMNHPQLVAHAIPALESVLGKDNVLLQRPHMGSEDFACFAEKIPGFYYWLGVRNDSRGINHMIHTPEFDVDENCLAIGVSTLSHLVLSYLQQDKS
ncbi:MAG: amidohydrolase [Terriglobia bacterium]